MSIDEMTGVQALERKHPGLPMAPGKVERREYEYIRHGTQSFIVSFAVVSGRVDTISCGDTRNEEDFVSHIKEVVESSSSASRWHFVADNLNIHKSESLVRYVADISDLDIDLGIKGKSGVLQSIESRESFLIDPSHSIVFHYKPIHASWMNQVEIWFSILVRKLLRRASFASIAVQMDISGESTYCLKLGLFKPRCTSLTNEVYAPKQRTAFTAHIKQLNVLAIIYISFSSFLHEQCAHVGLT